MKVLLGNCCGGFVAGLLFLLACDSANEGTAAQEQTKDKPLAAQSQFLAELDKVKYPEDKTRSDALSNRYRSPPSRSNI